MLYEFFERAFEQYDNHDDFQLLPTWVKASVQILATLELASLPTEASCLHEDYASKSNDFLFHPRSSP